ncbi:hypothetical protein [Streptomyces sp. NPDC056660]|uniref:hypothetical protein n=1 Tax=Streptomyces sp. NPDC056660 TaxID=3345897 RepID=UPI0036B699CD
MTQEQKADIESWYLKERKYVARMVTEHIAASIGEVQRQHRVRFTRWLRGTLTAMILITVAMALCFAAERTRSSTSLGTGRSRIHVRLVGS